MNTRSQLDERQRLRVISRPDGFQILVISGPAISGPVISGHHLWPGLTQQKHGEIRFHPGSNLFGRTDQLIRPTDPLREQGVFEEPPGFKKGPQATASSTRTVPIT